MGDLLQVKGIGKVMNARLNAGGVFSLSDLIRSYPSAYETHRIGCLRDAVPSEDITLCGLISKIPTVAYIRRRLTKMTFEFQTEGHLLKVAIFNREFLRSVLVLEAETVIKGRLDADGIHFVATEIQLRKHYREGIIPIYRFPDIGEATFAKLVLGAMVLTQNQIHDDIPEFLLKKNDVPSLSGFFHIVHQPRDEQDLAAATLRIKYDELLHFAVKIACMRRINDRTVTPTKNYDIQVVRRFIASLPFELTADQKEATNEIFRDLKRPRQMMRLLQGDVGSGKTIVAAIASLAVISAKEQVAVMAPTEVLARQNFQTLTELLAPFGVQTGFLSSSVKGKERENLLLGLKSGTIHLIAGTHSLIQEPIIFQRLGFAVIDEQHRFGVVQRKLLREKGLIPDMLFMSATPIPRTLAITMFGDMDVSSIKTMPEGRKLIHTSVCDYSQMDRIYDLVRAQVDEGHQAYVIVPLIQESEKAAFVDVAATVADFRKHLPKAVRTEGLHGRMPSEEKLRILDEFTSGEIHVLVSTTVVEVGVNVPNATVMAVLDCERFGLSQLHQLRGRVGRGVDQSYCRLVTDEIMAGNNRFEILEKTTDGFLISEEDLRQRGPGEVFGEEQTGVPRFRMANPVTDRALLDVAFADAQVLMTDSNPLSIRLVRATFSQIEETNID